MIYILDNFDCDLSHGYLMYSVIKNHSNVQIINVHLRNDIYDIEIYQILIRLIKQVNIDDIVLIPWLKEPDHHLDYLVDALTQKCHVVVSAGNLNRNIEEFSPTRSKKVTVVGCLNKSLQKAKHSNFSHYPIKWIIGTSYIVNNITHSGTSISAAIYSAFLANSFKDSSKTLDDTIQNYHDSIKL